MPGPEFYRGQASLKRWQRIGVLSSSTAGIASP